MVAALAGVVLDRLRDRGLDKPKPDALDDRVVGRAKPDQAEGEVGREGGWRWPRRPRTGRGRPAIARQEDRRGKDQEGEQGDAPHADQRDDACMKTGVGISGVAEGVPRKAR